MTSSTYVQEAIVNTTLSGESITSPGTGYVIGDEIVFSDSQTGENAEGTVATVGGSGDITGVTISSFGTGYTHVPTGTVTSENGTGASITFTTVTVNTGSNGDFLVNDITTDKIMFHPGGGAVLRVYFSVTWTGEDKSAIEVINNGDPIGSLNADNDSSTAAGPPQNDSILTDGYYRFDLAYESDDNINFQPAGGIAPTRINFFRAHFVRFGA